MQEEKSAVYTVILGVCLLLCLLMLGNMLMGRADTSTAPAAPEEDDAMEFHITEDDIASVLTEALPFPVEDTAVKISRDGTIAVTAAVTRQALTESNLWNTRMEQRDFTPQTIQWQEGEAVLLG